MVRNHLRRKGRGGGSAARGAGGDDGRRDQITVPGLCAVRAVEGPPGGFGYPLSAGGAGRGGAAFVDQLDGDAGWGRLVLQDLDESARPATAGWAGCAAVAVSTFSRPARVTHPQRADLAVDGPADHRL